MSYGAPLVAQVVKNLPAVQRTWARSLVWKDPLEKGMATHSSFLAWDITWTEEPGGLQSVGSHLGTWLNDYDDTMQWSQVSEGRAGLS